MDWVAEREMKIYQLFIASGGADTSKLDRFERRFQWCARVGRGWHEIGMGLRLLACVCAMKLCAGVGMQACMLECAMKLCDGVGVQACVPMLACMCRLGQVLLHAPAHKP